MRILSSFRYALILACALLVLPACAGLLAGQESSSGQDREQEEEGRGEQADRLPTPSGNLADYEDFDAAPYREEAPEQEREGLAHEVPARLMEGRAAEGVARTVPGFRIQILSTEDKDEAEQQLSAAARWWENQPEDAPDVFPEELPAYIVYRQPYYRVRLGDFTSREEAQKALQVVQRRYGDAFLASGTVTVTQ